MISTPRIRPCIIDVLVYHIQLLALLADDVGDVSEQLIQLCNTLLDISNLRFPLHD